jgi:two-component system, sensor histidine kinase
MAFEPHVRTQQDTADTGAAPARASRAQRLLADQVNTLYRQFLSGAIPGMVGAFFLVVAVWPYVSRLNIVTWLLALYAATIVRSLLYVRFLRTPGPMDQSKTWACRFVWGATASGLIWGIGGVIMFVPESVPHQAVLFVAFALLSVGAIWVNAYHVPAYYSFVTLLWLPLLVRTLAFGDGYHFVIAALIVIFALAFLWFGRTQNRLFLDSLNTRYENMDLIAELQQQKAEAERAREEAEIANRAKSQFLAAASHDLRQPLQALTLFTEALNERIYYPEVRNIVNNINSSVEALQALFNELLDISRLDAGVVVPHLVDFPVNQLLDRLRTDYTPQATERDLRLSIVSSKAVLHSDPTLLERVLRNFVMNAIRYTERGAIVVGCRYQRDGAVRIEVRDTGIGIAPEEHKRIFDEFYQLGNPERDRRKGLGLGLAIAKGIEKLLGCTIEVKSALGVGSVFSVIVPRGTSVPGAAPAPRSHANLKSSLRGSVIAVMDDERPLREGMQLLLSDWGCQVVAAASPDEVIAALRGLDQTPDLIVADYRLRAGVNGIEAVRRIGSAFGRDIPAVLVTGDTAADRLREARESGFILLHKPVVASQLSEALSRALMSRTGRATGGASGETAEGRRKWM